MEYNMPDRVGFWIDLWEDLINNFLKKSYGLKLYSPRILMEDIITEIEENSFRNSNNKKYFYSKLDYYFKNDTIVKNEFYSSFKILRKVFNSDRHEYILELCKRINKKLQKGDYFNSSVKLLDEELLNTEKVTLEFIDNVRYISENIIVDFLKKGYCLEDIAKFPKNIFDTFKFQKIDGINYIVTKYPHDINPKDFYDDEGNIKRTDYNEAVQSQLENLNDQTRIQTLLKYYYKQKERAYYIFILEGLKGSVNIEVAGVEFYSLDKKRFITGKNNADQEDLQSNNDDNDKFIQVAVEVEYLLPKSSLRDALTKVEIATDIISCYFKTDTPLEINASNYIIVQDGNFIFSSWSRDKRETWAKHIDSLDLNDIEKFLVELNENSFLWNDLKNNSKLLNAIHWFSKAEQSVKQEDKMLNYWIAIENLFNQHYEIVDSVNKSKINLIQEAISSVQILKFVYAYGWELYNHYSNQIGHLGRKTKLPKELIEKANLYVRTGEQAFLIKFVESLEEIKRYETNLFLIQKIDELIKFYNDNLFLKKMIDEQAKIIEDDILMIYRFRNLIVHNAHFDNTLLPYFVWKIRTYSVNLIRDLIKESQENGSELSNLITGLHLTKEQFLIDLENNNVDLFENIDDLE